jgi:hypothetical protein
MSERYHELRYNHEVDPVMEPDNGPTSYEQAEAAIVTALDAWIEEFRQNEQDPYIIHDVMDVIDPSYRQWIDEPMLLRISGYKGNWKFTFDLTQRVCNLVVSGNPR